MMDEATDCGNQEQVVLVFRWVDEDLTPHEEFIGLYQMASITAAALLAIVEDTILRLNLKLQHCHGQCYDAASMMSGMRSGLAKSVTDKKPRAISTPTAIRSCPEPKCGGHSPTVSGNEICSGCSDGNLKVDQKVS